jgi:molecular chaperone DnaK
MVRDAEQHAAEDKARREEAEVRNTADSLVYQTERLLREQGEMISADERSQVESRVGALKSALAGTDIEAIKSATEALMTASQQFGQRLYENAAANAPGGSDDDVVDAEIIDEND